jgi:hypothetical protein
MQCDPATPTGKNLPRRGDLGGIDAEGRAPDVARRVIRLNKVTNTLDSARENRIPSGPSGISYDLRRRLPIQVWFR